MSDGYFRFLLRLPIFFLIHAFFVMIYSSYYTPINSFTAYGLCFVFLLLTAADELIDSKALRIISQITISGSSAFVSLNFIPSPGPVILAIAAMLTYFLVSSPYEYERFKFNNAAGLCLVFFFICYFAKLDSSASAFYADGVIILILSRVCSHMHQTRSFINSYACRGKSKRSITELLRRNNRLSAVSVFVIAAAGLLAFASYHPAEPFLPAEFPLASPMPIAFNFQAKESRIEPAEQVETQEIIPEYDSSPKQTDEERFGLLKLIEAVVEVLIIILIIVLLIIRNKKNRAFTAGFDDYNEDLTDGIEFETARSNKPRIALLGTTAYIRRLYRKKVNDHRKKGMIISKSRTAKSISNEICRIEDISALDAAYHTARYSGKEVERSVVKALKEKT